MEEGETPPPLFYRGVSMKQIVMLIMMATAVMAGRVSDYQGPVGGGQEPVTVKLSDGRVVPFGAGVICDEVCTEEYSSISISREGVSKRKVLIGAGIIGGVVALIKLWPSGCCCTMTELRVISTEISRGPTGEVGEVGTLISLGTGLGLIGLALRRRG